MLHRTAREERKTKDKNVIVVNKAALCLFVFFFCWFFLHPSRIRDVRHTIHVESNISIAISVFCCFISGWKHKKKIVKIAVWRGVEKWIHWYQPIMDPAVIQPMMKILAIQPIHQMIAWKISYVQRPIRITTRMMMKTAIVPSNEPNPSKWLCCLFFCLRFGVIHLSESITIETFFFLYVCLFIAAKLRKWSYQVPHRFY